MILSIQISHLHLRSLWLGPRNGGFWDDRFRLCVFGPRIYMWETVLGFMWTTAGQNIYGQAEATIYLGTQGGTRARFMVRHNNSSKCLQRETRKTPAGRWMEYTRRSLNLLRKRFVWWIKLDSFMLKFTRIRCQNCIIYFNDWQAFLKLWLSHRGFLILNENSRY